MSVDSELFTNTCSDHSMFVLGSPPPTKSNNVTVPLPEPNTVPLPEPNSVPHHTPILYGPEFSRFALTWSIYW